MAATIPDAPIRSPEKKQFKRKCTKKFREKIKMLIAYFALPVCCQFVFFIDMHMS
jgi:hypothetical protein